MYKVLKSIREVALRISWFALPFVVAYVFYVLLVFGVTYK
jgi:hypothetical protein